MDNNTNGTLSNSGAQGGEVTLQRKLGPFQLLIYGMVFMGPMSGLLCLPATQLDTNGFSHIGFLVASALVVLTVSAYQKMLGEFPEAGSVYTYVSRGLNGKIGFLAGWILLIDYGLLPMYLLKLTAIYIASVFPAISWWVWLLLVSGIIIFLCFTGVKTVVAVENISGAFSFALVAIFCVGAVICIRGEGKPIFDMLTFYDANTINHTGVFNAAALGILSYVGFDAITTLTEESKVGVKAVQRVLMLAVVIVGIVFAGSTYLAQRAVPFFDLPADQQAVAYKYLLIKFYGPVIGKTLVVLKQLGTWAVIIASTVASSRILYAMGRDNVLPQKFFGHLSPRFKTPINNSLLIIGIATIGGLLLPWEVIAEVVSFGASLGFILVNISVFVYFWIRKKEHDPIRNLIVPFLAIAGLVYILINSTIPCLIVGTSWAVAGIVYLTVRYRSNESFRDAIDSCRIKM